MIIVPLIVPTNPSCMPVMAQRLIRALDACALAKDFYSPPRRKHGKNGLMDTLESMGLVQRYGCGFRCTPIGHAVREHCRKMWTMDIDRHPEKYGKAT